MQGWMSRDGERQAVPAPTCSAGSAQGGGTRLAPPAKPSRPGEGRRREETDSQTQAPEKPARLGCTMKPGCVARVTARLVLCSSSQHLPVAPDPHRPGWDTVPAPSTKPACLIAAQAGEMGDHRAGEGSWACPSLARALCSGRAPGWLASPSGERLEGLRASAPSPKPHAAGDGGCPHPFSRTHGGILTGHAG